MNFLKNLLTVFILLILANCCYASFQAQIDSLIPGIYTSIEQINKNEPQHLLQPEMVKYNNADIYFVKKVKLKLLKEAVALSNGKALYLHFGNYKGKKGFIESSFDNWFEPQIEKDTTNNKQDSQLISGLYSNILDFKKPEIKDTALQFEQKGSKNIYALKNYSSKQLSNIIAAVNEQDIYLVTGSYLNQIAFVKNQIIGRYLYFETPTSTLIEASSSNIFNTGVSNLNATALLQQPNLKKVGILYDVKTNQLNLLTNNAQKNFFTILPAIQNYPALLLQFVKSAKLPEDCKEILRRLNALH